LKNKFLDIFQEGFKESLKSAREEALQGGFESGFSEGYAQGLLAGRIIGISSYVLHVLVLLTSFLLFSTCNLFSISSSAVDLAPILGITSIEGIKQILQDAKALNTESTRKAEDYVLQVEILQYVAVQM
jgi:hypothetical protein